MPELPEVETMRRGILSIEGATILSARRTRCQRRPIQVVPGPAGWKKNAVGQTIEAIERVGKRVVLRLSQGYRIVFEPRMTGLVLLTDPPTREHLRFELQLENCDSPKLWYWDRRGLGSVHLFSEKEFEDKFLRGRIGPDALQVSAKDLALRFETCRQAIKPALLDQKRVAGVGNLYASELLHAAGVHPTRRCCDLTASEWKKIHRQMLNVLKRAIAYEGSTLSDGTYRNALNQEGGFQNHHRVYDREGKECRGCKSPILRIVQTQRATFYCEQCQS